MRFKIIFQVKGDQRLLPLSYKYELSSWIYKQIERADSPFAEFLHTQGYILNGKRFKLFTFSDIHFRKYEIIGDRVKLLSPEISFVISFFVDKAAESLVMGLFHQQCFELGDQITQVRLQVKSLKVLPLVIPNGPVRLKTTGPMVVSRQPNLDIGEKQAQYLSPLDDKFEEVFFQNLLNKYSSALIHNLVSKIDVSSPRKFLLLREKPKSRLIKIKAHRPDETKIRGYLFDFELTAPKELIRFGMLSGFGVANAMGFGSTRIIHS
ncbi:MAG: CRISPR-associated endoribonuclease Cas6 [Bacteroidota bacterium]